MGGRLLARHSDRGDRRRAPAKPRDPTVSTSPSQPKGPRSRPGDSGTQFYNQEAACGRLDSAGQRDAPEPAKVALSQAGHASAGGIGSRPADRRAAPRHGAAGGAMEGAPAARTADA